MDRQEKDRILQSARLLEEYENTPRTFDDQYSDMTTEEKSRLLSLQQQMLKAKDKEIEAQAARADEILSKLDFITDVVRELRDEKAQLLAEYRSLQMKYNQQEERIAELLQSKAALAEQLVLSRKNQYGSKSLKGTSRKKPQEPDRQQEKDDFDGKNGSREPVEEDQASSDAPDQTPKDRTPNQKMADMLRRGSRYRKMTAGNTVTHLSDPSRIPTGAEFVKFEGRYAYEQKVSIIEHEYQLVTYRLDGVLYTAYLPAEGEPQIIDRVQGTKASSEFLAHLSFNRFCLDTPLYREVDRLRDENMSISRMTLTNWLHKGSLYLSGIVDYLKEIALEKDSVINCDETWCRVKVEDRYRKRYIWCLVNRKLRIAIYCYEDGSRSRDALKSIIKNKELKALQSDGYNVYMYLDSEKEMIGIEHVCCLAHARAKFRYALEQSDDPDAKYILECIAGLYALEKTYQAAGLSEQEITEARRSPRTIELIGMIRSKLHVLLSDDHPPRGELMEKAVRYLDTFWDQIFAYTNNGRYSIDNNAAERCIRPLAGERKNSLFFGSDKMVKASAIYHTVIQTCRLAGISVLDYLKKFFSEIVRGNRDYSSLMPQTIGLPIKNV